MIQQLGDLFELIVATGSLSHGPRLPQLAAVKFDVGEQLSDNVDTDGRAGLCQAVGDFKFCQVGPLDLLPHRIAGSMASKNFQKVGAKVRHAIKTAWTSPPLCERVKDRDQAD